MIQAKSPGRNYPSRWAKLSKKTGSQTPGRSGAFPTWPAGVPARLGRGIILALVRMRGGAVAWGATWASRRRLAVG